MARISVMAWKTSIAGPFVRSGLDTVAVGTQPTPEENIERAAEIREALRGLVA